MNPEKIIQAHQYLYYVKTKPIWTDYQYDRYCSKYNIEGGGGSDREDDYPADIKDLAHQMLTTSEYVWDKYMNAS